MDARTNKRWCPSLHQSVSRKAGFPSWMFLNSPRKMLGMQSKSEMSRQAQWIPCKNTLPSPINWFVSILSSFRKEATQPVRASLDLEVSGQRRSCLISLWHFCGWNSPLRLILNQRRPRFWVQARIHHQLVKLVDKLFESKKNNHPH